jgi:hypothetical protein
MKRLIRLDDSENFFSIHSWKIKVKEDNIRPRGYKRIFEAIPAQEIIESRVSISCQINASRNAPSFERPSEDSHMILVILNYKDCQERVASH